MNKLRTGIVGVGFIGQVHIEALRRLGGVDVVALCDPDSAREKAAKLYIDHAYSDYKEMIKMEELDFVHICTPNFTHFEIASYAIENGINVVLEKPMTVTIDEASSLVELAKKHNVVAAVNFHNRFYPTAHYLKEKIQRRELGRIISISGCYLQDWLLYETDYSWRLVSSQSGITRAVSDIGSHWIDLVEYTTGLHVSEVMADFQTVYPVRKKAKGPNQTFSNQKADDYEDVPIHTEDMASLLLRFENGAIGTCFLSQMFAGKKNKIQLYIAGSEASAEWDLDQLNDLVLGYRRKANEIVTKDASLMGEETAELISCPPGHAEGFPDAFKQAFNQIYKKARDPKFPSVFATFEDGLREMMIGEKIYESAQKHQFVKIN